MARLAEAPPAPPATATSARRLSPRARLHVVTGPRPGRDAEALRNTLGAHPGLAPGQLVWHAAPRARQLPELAAAAAQRARQDGGVLVACGGDGTINTVARAAWPLGVPMAVLPEGTFNFFARDHGLGEDLEEALGLVLQGLQRGHCKPVPVGLVDHHLFVVNASLGLYPKLLDERERASRRIGRHRLVAIVSGLRALFRPDPGQQLHLKVQHHDGSVQARTRRLATLFIGNNTLQLAQLGFDGAAELGVDRDRLGALMFAPQDRSTMARLLWRALRRRLPEEPAVESFGFTELEVHDARPPGRRRQRPVRVALDGETRWMRLPLRVARADRPLWLVAPPDGAAG